MRRMVNSAITLAIGTAALALGAPALATPTVVNQSNCNIMTPSPNAVACTGFWTSNLLSSSPTDLGYQTTALASIGYTFGGTATAFNALTGQSHLTTGGLLNFGQTLYGITYIGVHFGDAGTGLGDRTVFYEFNFGTGGNTGITLNTSGFSNAVLYATGVVPEPATWAMMLVGFAGMGFAVRRSRRHGAALMQVA